MAHHDIFLCESIEKAVSKPTKARHRTFFRNTATWGRMRIISYGPIFDKWKIARITTGLPLAPPLGELSPKVTEREKALSVSPMGIAALKFRWGLPRQCAHWLAMT